MSAVSTYGAGVRLPYAALPEALRLWVELTLGGEVVEVADKRGGFSPGVAAVVTTTGGEQGFVKAVAANINPDSLTLHRQEVEVAGELPALDAVPALLAATTIEQGDDTWGAAIYAVADGAPPAHPWSPADVTTVLGAMEDLAAALTPSPWPPDDERDRRFDSFFTGWSRIADDPDDAWHGVEWVRRNLVGLVEAEAALIAALPGATLTHRDLRADNLLVGGSRVWFCDWAHPGNAAAFVDPALLLCDVVGSRADRSAGGDIDLADLIEQHDLFSGVDRSIVWATVAALAATMHVFSARPAPDGLPTIRAWQRQLGDDLLAFCTHHRPHWR